MASFVDLENPLRTDYFSHVITDTVEPSSSPSDESNNSPYRTLLDEPLRVSDPDSHSPDRHHNDYNAGGDRSSRKHAQFYIREARESRKMSALLLLTSERLEKEIRRANDAERKNAETMTLLRSTVEAKMLAQQEAARVNEELGLYKLQFENAQREIYKAQDLINQIEAQRREAEEAAARARSTARKLKEQNLMILAREEGRQLGYKEGMARGRRMGYEEGRAVRFEKSMRDDYVDRSDDDSNEQDYVPADHRSNSGRLRSSSVAPVGEQEQLVPRTSPDGPSTSPHETDGHAPTFPVPMISTPANPPSPSHAASPPPSFPTPVVMPPVSRKRGKSESQINPVPVRNVTPSPPPRPSSAVPPDNWIPKIDKDNHIAMPPPHQMSPSVSPLYSSQQLPKSGLHTPSQPDITVMRAVIDPPPSTSILVRDYAYDNLPRGRSEGLRKTAQPGTPTSQTSTRMSDYGLLTSPTRRRDSLRRGREDRSSTSAPGDSGWKYDPRTWGRRKSKPRSSPPRVSGGPRPRPESITQPPLPIPPPVITRITIDRQPPGVTRSSTLSSPSSSASSTSDRAKHDPRRDEEGGSRTSIGWLFKKRYRDRIASSGSSSSPSVGIAIVSPSNSSQAGHTPTTVTQPQLLSPEYREVSLPVLSNQPVTRSSTPRAESQQRHEQNDPSSSLPPLAEFSNLMLPGALKSSVSLLPLGFVPDAIQQPHKNRRSSSSASTVHVTAEQPLPISMPPPLPQSPNRPESRNFRTGSERQEGYETAPLTPGVSYPAPPSPSRFTEDSMRSRSKSRSRTLSPPLPSG